MVDDPNDRAGAAGVRRDDIDRPRPRTGGGAGPRGGTTEDGTDDGVDDVTTPNDSTGGDGTDDSTTGDGGEASVGEMADVDSMDDGTMADESSMSAGPTADDEMASGDDAMTTAGAIGPAVPGHRGLGIAVVLAALLVIGGAAVDRRQG